MALHELSINILKARKSEKKCYPKYIEKWKWNLLNTRTCKKIQEHSVIIMTCSDNCRLLIV